MRRYRLSTTLLVVLALLAAACGGDDDESAASSDTSATEAPAADEGASTTDAPAADTSDLEVVKVGQVLPFTSVLSGLTEPEGFGAEVAVQQINEDGGIAGKWRVELVQKDDQLDEARMATVMRELADEGVDFTFGFQITPNCKAATGAAAPGQIVLGSHCTSDTLTDPPLADNFWRLSQPDRYITKAMGVTLAEEFPDIDHVDVVGFDYEVGRDLWASSQESMSEALGRDVPANQEFWVPIGVQEFRNEVSALSRGLQGDVEERLLFLATYGGGTTAFLQQAEPIGLFEEYSGLAQIGAYWEVALALGERAPNIWNAYEYFWDCHDNEMNDRFVEDYEALAGSKPESGAYQAYNSVKFYAAAIEAADSVDPAAVQEAFAGLSIPTPTGIDLVMDEETHQAEGTTTVANLVGDSDAPDTVGILNCDVQESADLLT